MSKEFPEVLEQARHVAGFSNEDLIEQGFRLVMTVPKSVEAARDDVKREFGIDLPLEAVSGLMACGAGLVFLNGKQAALEYLRQNGG